MKHRCGELIVHHVYRQRRGLIKRNQSIPERVGIERFANDLFLRQARSAHCSHKIIIVAPLTVLARHVTTNAHGIKDKLIGVNWCINTNLSIKQILQMRANTLFGASRVGNGSRQHVVDTGQITLLVHLIEQSCCLGVFTPSCIRLEQCGFGSTKHVPIRTTNSCKIRISREHWNIRSLACSVFMLAELTDQTVNIELLLHICASATNSIGDKRRCLPTAFGSINKEPGRGRTLLHLTTNNDLLTICSRHVLIRARQRVCGQIRLLKRLILALTLTNVADKTFTVLALHRASQSHAHKVAHLINSGCVRDLLVVPASSRGEIQRCAVVIDTAHPLLLVAGIGQAHRHIRSRKTCADLTGTQILFDRVRNTLFGQHIEHSPGAGECIGRHELTGVVTTRFRITSTIEYPLTNVVVLSRRHATHEFSQTRDIIKTERLTCFFRITVFGQAIELQLRGRDLFQATRLTVCKRGNVIVENIQNRRTSLLDTTPGSPPRIIGRNRKTRSSSSSRPAQTNRRSKVFVQRLVALARCISRLEQRLVAWDVLTHDALNSVECFGDAQVPIVKRTSVFVEFLFHEISQMPTLGHQDR